MTRHVTLDMSQHYRDLDQLTLSQLELMARSNTHISVRSITLMPRDQLIWAIIRAENAPVSRIDVEFINPFDLVGEANNV